MPAATIRDATVADARGIAEVHVAAWRWAYDGLMPAAILEALSVDERTERWRETFAAPPPGWGCAVAEAGGRVVGFVSYGGTEDGGAPEVIGEVYALYLDPPVVGGGIGRGLLARAIGALRDAGRRRACLWVLATNERARGFYERAGWTWDGTTSAHRFDGVELPIVRYAADL